MRTLDEVSKTTCVKWPLHILAYHVNAFHALLARIRIPRTSRIAFNNCTARSNISSACARIAPVLFASRRLACACTA
eukprot:6199391-Pleurochrysis_carterae.AAC.1